MKTIKDLYELAELINTSEDYPLEVVEAVIETNGWEDLTGSEYDVCSDGKNKVVLDENTGTAKVVDDIKYTYDVIFNDDNSSNNKGIHGSKDECMRWIESNRHDSSTYFGDYKGGTVSIVCDQTEETVYEEEIRNIAMKEEIISQLGFEAEEYKQKVAGQKGMATFDEFINTIIESVKDNNGTVQDAIFIANDAFAKL